MEKITKNDRCSLVGGYRIFQTKRHYCIAVYTLWCLKGRLVLIFRVHFDLIVPQETIHERQSPNPVVASTRSPVIGSGKSSLGHALYKSLKSTHIRSGPFFFRTGTMLATQVGY